MLDVCWRVLRHAEDAEDAFQATFLVLARKATALRWQESVGSWLYAVAYRLTLKSRAARLHRQVKERQSASGRAEPSLSETAWLELSTLLDAELQRLPEKFRAPLLLCCLEGRTRDEAAQLLGWSVGKLKGRLERGRQLLRVRLARRGLTLSVGLLASGLSQSSAQAVPAVLLATTAKAAAGAGEFPPRVYMLAEGVLRAMFLTKLKIIAALFLTLGVAGAGSAWTLRVWAAEQDRLEKAAVAATPGNDDLRQELKRLQRELKEARDETARLRDQLRELARPRPEAARPVPAPRALAGLKDGERALSLRFTRQSIPYNAGDTVDILTTRPGQGGREPTCRVVAQNIKVLAVRHLTEHDLVTLTLMPADAVKLAVSFETGKLWLLLRPSAGNPVLAKLKADELAITVPVDGSTFSGCEVGDKVDVLAIRRAGEGITGQVIVENVEILAKPGPGVALRVTKEQAEKLARYADYSTLRFLSRPPEE